MRGYICNKAGYDATSGLYFFRNRDYSPTLGRWVSLDPIGFIESEHDLYRYEGDQPATRLDPTGLFEVIITEKHTEWLSKFGTIEFKFGGFAWPVNYRLDQPSNRKKGGFIFQHVKITYSITDEKNNPVRPSIDGTEKRFPDDVRFDYWEAWAFPRTARDPAPLTKVSSRVCVRLTGSCHSEVVQAVKAPLNTTAKFTTRTA